LLLLTNNEDNDGEKDCQSNSYHNGEEPLPCAPNGRKIGAALFLDIRLVEEAGRVGWPCDYANNDHCKREPCYQVAAQLFFTFVDTKLLLT